jgi:hypothetical protein
MSVHAGAYVETKHPTWHDSFKLPALKGKSMTQLYIEVSTARRLVSAVLGGGPS